MNVQELEEAIYERYINPTKRKRTRRVGLEFEFPIVNQHSKPVDFGVVHRLTDDFIRRFGFASLERDDDGYIYSALDDKTGDGLSYDCSYNTLEFSFGVEEDMGQLNERFRQYYSFVQDNLQRNHHTLTGMGINPHYQINQNIPVSSERYRMLLHHLSSYPSYGQKIPFHHHPNFGMFSCASQIQMDVQENMLVETLNTFTKLEPLKTLLLANSPWGKHYETLCSRDGFWKNSLHGLNRHNVDIYDLQFESVDEIVAYIQSMSIYCVEREGKYINFPPTKLTDYFAADQLTGEYFDGETYQSVTFHPERSDLHYLRSFKFEDLTFRGTVEFRSVCEQPVSEIMASGALHAGLIENLHSLTEKLDSDHVIYHKGYNPSELRHLFNQRELPDIFDRKEISGLLLDILRIAEDGLQRRGFGEERFLQPLYPRAEQLLSPARQMVDGLLSHEKTMDDYIAEFGRL